MIDVDDIAERLQRVLAREAVTTGSARRRHQPPVPSSLQVVPSNRAGQRLEGEGL